MESRSPVEIRPFVDADLEAVVTLWNETKRHAYPYLPLEQTRTIAEDRVFFLERILPRCVVDLVLERAAPCGFLAMEGDYIDRLYVHPDHQRRGFGVALLEKAFAISPEGLRLHTHVRNEAARAFYEKHGFRVVRFGVSPAPESEPDVEYAWKP